MGAVDPMPCRRSFETATRIGCFSDYYVTYILRYAALVESATWLQGSTLSPDDQFYVVFIKVKSPPRPYGLGCKHDRHQSKVKGTARLSPRKVMISILGRCPRSAHPTRATGTCLRGLCTPPLPVGSSLHQTDRSRRRAVIVSSNGLRIRGKSTYQSVIYDLCST